MAVSTRSGRRNAKVTRKNTATGRRSKTTPTSSAKSVEDAKTMGEAIQMAESTEDHLYIADKWVWLPSDADLPPHLRSQLVHTEKRRRWGSQLLKSLGQSTLNAWETDPSKMMADVTEEGHIRHIWTDERLIRAVLSVCLPMEGSSSSPANRPDKEGVWIAEALKGLHVLAGCIMPHCHSTGEGNWMTIHRAIANLIRMADDLSESMPLRLATELRWSIRGLNTRLQLANVSHQIGRDGKIFKERVDFTTPKLNARVRPLPFDIIHHCLEWEIDYTGYPSSKAILPTMLKKIPFNFDTITTRTGSKVIERRGTAWLAESNIGALAYSGKLMAPSPPSDEVRALMRDIEKELASAEFESTSSVAAGSTQVEFVWDDYTYAGQDLEHFNGFFDCALCNHYPDGDAACKFHSDPEHGSHWHRTTAVVSAGQSRPFAFRPIPELTTWEEWDSSPTVFGSDTGSDIASSAALQLFPGDVVLMTGKCNDVFHHAVYASQSQSDLAGSGSSRVSLVFKRALDRGGRKGHGVRGQGRRSKSRQNSHTRYDKQS